MIKILLLATFLALANQPSAVASPADSAYTCSVCTPRTVSAYNFETHGDWSYNGGSYNVYYQGLLLEEKTDISMGKCVWNLVNDDRCGFSPTGRKFACGNCGLNIYRTRYKYDLYYDSQFYSEEEFDTPGSCQLERDRDFHCAP